MRSTDRTSRPLVAVPDLVHRHCHQGCDWEVIRPTALEAALEEATHWVQDHATAADRDDIADRVQDWREHWASLDSGPWPVHLLVQVVIEVRCGVVSEVAA